MALVSESFYHLVIPKLYETIVISERNHGKVTQSLSLDRCLREHWRELPSLEPVGRPPWPAKTRSSRKILALTHCRRIILDGYYTRRSSAVDELIRLLVATITASTINLSSTKLGVLLNEGYCGLERNAYSKITYDNIRDLKTWEDSIAYPAGQERRIVVHLPKLQQDGLLLVARAIASLSTRAITLIIYGQNLKVHGRPSSSSRYRHDPHPDTTTEVHFDPESTRISHGIRLSLLGYWVARFFGVVCLHSDVRKLILVDIPLLILSDKDLPDDAAEASKMALVRMGDSLNRWIHGQTWMFRPHVSFESVIAQIDLIDSKNVAQTEEPLWPMVNDDDYGSDSYDPDDAEYY